MINVFAPAFREELVNLLQPERGHRHTSSTESASSLTSVSLSVSNASDFEDEGDRDPKLPFVSFVISGLSYSDFTTYTPGVDDRRVVVLCISQRLFDLFIYIAV